MVPCRILGNALKQALGAVLINRGRKRIKEVGLMVFKSTLLAVFIVLSVSAFGQNTDLSLDSSDIRFEFAFENESPVGYNLFVRKKPGIESVMVTEPTGNYALRSLGWNAINGNERRELSGVTLTDTHSRFSLLSSTPVADWLFVEAFQLFIPLWVVYGNPSSPRGTVYMDINEGVQINIRTFDHKYGDPNTGSFLNYLTMVNTMSDNYGKLAEPMLGPGSRISDFIELRRMLVRIGINEIILNSYSNFELEILLKGTIRRK